MKKLIAIILFVGLHSAICSLQSFAQSLDSAEYFFDTDPGVGNGTPIAITPSDTVLDSVFTSTAGLAKGFHNLFVRVKDTNNIWSLYEGSRFYLYDTIAQSTPASHPIASAEYFYDTDPGIGNGIALDSFASADSILLTDTLPPAALTAGTHYLFVRVRDTMNVWSLYEGKSFVVCNFVPAPDFSADTVCVNKVTSFTDLSTHVDTSFNYTYGWDFNNDSIIDDTTRGNTTHTFSTPGTHTVSLVVNNTNGCSDTIVKTVYVDSLPSATLVLPFDTICKDDTLILSGGSPAGGVYSGTGVYGGILYADSVSSGGLNIFYTYYNSDSCSVQVSDKLYISYCTGIQEYDNGDFSVSISPNPFSEKTTIEVISNRPSGIGFEFRAYDLFGKEVMRLPINTNRLLIDRGNLVSGVYLYKVITPNGNFVSGKLIVID